MSEALKNVQCDICTHKEVCSLKERFLEEASKIKSEIDWIKVEVKCNHYEGRLQSNIPITVPSMTYSNCRYGGVNCSYKVVGVCHKPITATCPYELASSTSITYSTKTEG